MSTTISGVSTLGVVFKYDGVTVPRCNSISGIELSNETIDASALEDLVERSIPGRQSTGGEWTVTFNATPESLSALNTMISASNTAKNNGTTLTFTVEIPTLGTFTVKGLTGSSIPMPDISQNELLTVDISITIDTYVGFSSSGGGVTT